MKVITDEFSALKISDQRRFQLRHERDGLCRLCAVKAAPDGYTFGWVISAHAINPSLYSKLPYDPLKDLTPIVNIGSSPVLFVVAVNSPFKTFGELLAAAKAQPDAINYASSGSGTVAHYRSLRCYFFGRNWVRLN